MLWYVDLFVLQVTTKSNYRALDTTRYLRRRRRTVAARRTHTQGRFCVGTGDTCPPDSLVAFPRFKS